MKLFERKKNCKFYVTCDINEVPAIRYAFNPYMERSGVTGFCSDIERLWGQRVRVSFEMVEKPSRAWKAFKLFFSGHCQHRYPMEGVIVA